MKQIIIFLALGLLLTGCFGGEKQAVDNADVVTPDVVVDEIITNGGDITVE